MTNTMALRSTTRFVILLLVLFGFLWIADRRTASAESPNPSSLAIAPIGEARAGEYITLNASLSNKAGETVSGLTLDFYVNGAQHRRIEMDADGNASVKVREDNSGNYLVEVFFAGTKSILPAVASTEFSVKPALLDIQVVPPMPGVEVTAGDQTYQSDANGLIHIEQSQAGDSQLHLVTQTVEGSGSHAVFSRWLDNLFVPDRSVAISSYSHLELGFDVSNLVTLQFSDPDSNSIEFSRISSATLKSTTGIVHSYTTDEPHWLETSRVVRRKYGLESAQIQWGVDNVTVDGSNVVNQGQQRFVANPNDTWDVQLLLYSTVIDARDALFGHPIGAGVVLVDPSGAERTIPFDAQGKIKLASLARGKYQLRVTGAGGFAAVSPLDLSRSQTVHLIVVSYSDAAIVTGALLIVALWLLFIGRPTLLHAIGIRWPATPDRKPFVRTGLAVIAFASALLLTFDFRSNRDNLPILPDVNSASAKPADQVLAPASSSILSAISSTGPAATPSPETGNPVQQPPATPSPDAQPSLVLQYSVSPVFANFWENNGALPVFGYPIGNEIIVDARKGIVEQRFERQWLEYHPELVGTPYVIQLSLTGLDFATRHGLIATPPFQPVAPGQIAAVQSGTDCVYFDVTQHTVCGEFLQYWQQHGLDFGDDGTSYRESLALFGFPISEPFVEPDSGLTVQYFERARFEYHPDKPKPHKVLLGRLEASDS